MPDEVELRFSGPYSWLADPLPSVLDAPASESPGLYLWSVPTTSAGELIYYVGETGRNFRSRFVEHLQQQISGWYRLYDPAAMQKGTKRLLWRGLYGSGAEVSIAPFVERLEELATPLRGFIRLVRFYLGPTDVEVRLRRRIEAAIADALYAQDEPVGGFQDTGIRYERRKAEEAPVRVRIMVPVILRGLPVTVAA